MKSRKAMILILSALMIISITGCSKKDESSNNNESSFEHSDNFGKNKNQDLDDSSTVENDSVTEPKVTTTIQVLEPKLSELDGYTDYKIGSGVTDGISKIDGSIIQVIGTKSEFSNEIFNCIAQVASTNDTLDINKLIIESGTENTSDYEYTIYTMFDGKNMLKIATNYKDSIKYKIEILSTADIKVNQNDFISYSSDNSKILTNQFNEAVLEKTASDKPIVINVLNSICRQLDIDERQLVPMQRDEINNGETVYIFFDSIYKIEMSIKDGDKVSYRVTKS